MLLLTMNPTTFSYIIFFNCLMLRYGVLFSM